MRAHLCKIPPSGKNQTDKNGIDLASGANPCLASFRIYRNFHFYRAAAHLTIFDVLLTSRRDVYERRKVLSTKWTIYFDGLFHGPFLLHCSDAKRSIPFRHEESLLLDAEVVALEFEWPIDVAEINKKRLSLINGTGVF